MTTTRTTQAPETRTPLEYPLRYEVEAGNRLAAIMAAGAKLRDGVVVTELRSAEPIAVGWWAVVMDVREGEPEHGIGCPARHGDGDCDE